MSTLDPQTRAVVRALDALSTHARRIADALETPVVRYEVATDDAPTTGADPVHILGIKAPDTDDVRVACPDCSGAPLFRPGEITDHIVRHRTGEQQALAAGEAAHRATRRSSIRNLLDRAGRGVLIGGTEGELLRQQVEAELRLSDQLRAGRATWKAKAEEIERDRDRIAAELAEAQAALNGMRDAAHLHRKKLFSTAELYAVIGPTDLDNAEQTDPAPLRVTPCNPPRMAVHCGGECLTILDSDPDRNRTDKIALVGDTITCITGRPGCPAPEVPAGAHYLAEVLVPRGATAITAANITSSGLLFHLPTAEA